MDKQTLSNYGWLVIVTLILAVMLALATPFGTYVGDAVVSVANGYVGASNNAMDDDNISNMEQQWFDKLNDDPLVHKNIIPKGATYTKVDGTILNAGDEFPSIVKDGDMYSYGDYQYKYNYNHQITQWVNDTTQNGWGVKITDKTKTKYDEILKYINNKPITNTNALFNNCVNLEFSPQIPDTVINTGTMFQGCSSLKKAPKLPSNVQRVDFMFNQCTQLIDISEIKLNSNITSLYCFLSGCENLVDISTLIIPSSVDDMRNVFTNCSKLNGTITINANPTTYEKCFYQYYEANGTIKIMGSCSQQTKENLASTNNRNNVTY